MRTIETPRFVLLDRKFRIAGNWRQEGEDITADIYRNLDDFREGRVMISNLAFRYKFPEATRNAG